MQFPKIFLYKAQNFHIWYITFSRGPLPNLFKLCPWGLNLTPTRRSQFYIELYKETWNDFYFQNTNRNMTKLNKNDPQVVPFQNCSNGSDWLHKQVTGSKIRFQNANLKKSSIPILHGQYVCNIIQWSSTKIVKIMPLGSKEASLRGSLILNRVIQENILNIILLKNHKASNSDI